MVSISIRSVSKFFGPIKALDGVSMEVDTPLVLGLLGPNGAGKSTLLKLLTGVLRPTSGKVLINGTDVQLNQKKVLSEVGTLLETPQFYPYLTGYESLRFVCLLRGFSKKQCEQEIDRVARLTGSRSYLSRKTGNYSSGMKQRLGIASALLCKPRILVLDEPTSGLDPRGMKEVREIIRNISKEGEHIVILSTHLLSEAREICDKVAIIDQGKLVYESDRIENENSVTVRLLGDLGSKVLDSPIIEEYRTEWGLLVIKKSPGSKNHDLIKYLMSIGLEVEEISAYNDLEDRYIRIVGDSTS